MRERDSFRREAVEQRKVDVLLHVTGLAPRIVSAWQQSLGLEVDVNMAINVQFEGGALGSIAIVGQSPGIGGSVYEDVTCTGSEAGLYYRVMGQPSNKPVLQLRRAGSALVAGDQWVRLDELRQHLPAGSVFIDIASFPVFDFQATGTTPRSYTFNTASGDIALENITNANTAGVTNVIKTGAGNLLLIGNGVPAGPAIGWEVQAGRLVAHAT